MITYEILRKISTQERETKKLSPLPPNFFSDARVYFSRKSKIKSEDNWELESAMHFFQEILERREAKILMHALYNVRSGFIPENMTKEEEEFFNKIVKCIEEFRKRKDELMKETETYTVAITQPLPEFVGIDMKVYGPFERGDIVTLPKEICKLLISKNVAEKIDIEKIDINK